MYKLYIIPLPSCFPDRTEGRGVLLFLGRRDDL
jgi:hypothetical protein